MKVGVLFWDETAWLTQRSLAELFGVGVPAVNKQVSREVESFAVRFERLRQCLLRRRGFLDRWKRRQQEAAIVRP